MHNPFKEQNFNLFIPGNRLTKMGVVRDIPPYYTPEFLLKEMKCDNVEIASVVRLKRSTIVDNKPKKIETNSVLIKFLAESLPPKIKFLYSIYSVEAYNPQVKTCFRCYRFNHVAGNCKGRDRCVKCGQDKHKDEISKKNCDEKHKTSNASIAKATTGHTTRNAWTISNRKRCWTMHTTMVQNLQKPRKC